MRVRWPIIVLFAACLAILGGLAVPAGAQEPAARPQPQARKSVHLPVAVNPPPPPPAPERLVLAHYYQWYCHVCDPKLWTPANTADRPEQPYISAEPATIDRQVKEGVAAHMDGFITSWSGQGDFTDDNFALLLDRIKALKVKFKATVQLEGAGANFGGVNAVSKQLNYLWERYGRDPNIVRYQGKMLVFLWRAQNLGPGAWNAIRQSVDPDHSRLIWIAEGLIGNGDVWAPAGFESSMDGDYLYLGSSGPGYVPGRNFDLAKKYKNLADDTRAKGKIWAGTAFPGVDSTRQGGYYIDRQGGNFYSYTWQAALDSGPEIMTITSYNEWFEGHQIEPGISNVSGANYGTHYLDITRTYADQFHAR